MKKIRNGDILFLYNYDWDILFGVFEADGKGGKSIDRHAWRERFPAQVKIRWSELHRLSKASETFPYLTNRQIVKLPPESTTQFIKALKESPLYSPQAETPPTDQFPTEGLQL